MSNDDGESRERRRHRSRRNAAIIDATASEATTVAPAGPAEQDSQPTEAAETAVETVIPDMPEPVIEPVPEAQDVQPAEPAAFVEAQSVVEESSATSPVSEASLPETPPPEAPPPELAPTSTEAAPPAEPIKPDIIAVPTAEDPTPAKPRYALPMALAGILGAVFGAGAGGILPGLLGGPAVDPARLGAIERTVAELARRPVAPPPAPAGAVDAQALDKRFAAIEADLVARLAALDQKLAAMPVPANPPASAPAAPPVDLGPLNDRLGALERALPLVDQKAEAAKPVDIAPLSGRLAAIEQATAALDQKAEAARAAAGEAAKALEPQIQQLAARLNQTAQRIEVTAAAPVYSAVQALGQAVQRGAPFPAEVAALEALGVKGDQLTALKALADKGVASAQRLAETFQPLAMETARAGQPAATGVNAVFQSLVKTRPTGPGAAETPQGLVAAIEAALRSGDVPGALAAWAKLPEPARRASESWAAAARERDAVQKAVKDLQDAALATLRKAAP